MIIILVFCLIPLPAGFLHGLDDPYSFEIERVKKDPTFHKKVDGFTLNLSAEQMTYLLDNLPVTTVLLNKYGIHTLRIRATGPDAFHAEDESGLEGIFELVGGGEYDAGTHTAHDRTVREYAGHGWIASGVITSISADVIARISFEESEPGNTVNELEFWVVVDGLLLDILCRIFRPVLLSILTNKFDDFIEVVQNFTNRIQGDPGRAAEILRKNSLGEHEIEEFRRLFVIR